MTSALSQIIVASGEHAEEGGHAIVNELPFESIWFGVIALAAFMALLLILLAFRNSLALEPHGAPGVHATSDEHGPRTS
jgi:hypothetical protein